MKVLIYAFLLIFIFSCTKKFYPEISVEDIKMNVSYLASDSLQGRKSGTKYDLLAAEYIRGKFRNAGLKMAYDNGFQEFSLITSADMGPDNSLSFNGKSYEPGKDFLPYSFSANKYLSEEVLFGGYGFDIKNDSIKWNDYSSINVQGKWVLILKGDPDINKTVSAYAGFSEERMKVLTAVDHNAGGVILVGGPVYNEKDDLSPIFYDRNSSRYPIPVIQVTRALADQLLAKSGKTVEALEKFLNTSLQPNSFKTGTEVSSNINVIFTEAKSRNVIAIIPGIDGTLASEYVVVGAHFDHLGIGGPGSGSRATDTIAVHNGADDNASGVATIIELAEKAASEKKNRRSLIFAAFGAEEMGLIGSKTFTAQPPVDIKKIVAMFNFDMVGRLDTAYSLSIGGSGTSAESENILKSLNKNLRLAFSPEGFGPSDHASFYIENIPVFFISTGAHSDYHTPDDDADLINYEGMKTISEYSYLAIKEVANRDNRLTFREAGPKIQKGRAARFKVTFGIMPDYAGTETKGLRIDAVTKGKPAEAGGMKKGDIITAIEGKNIGNIYDYMNRLKDLSPGQRVSVDILRDGKPVILIIQL